MSLEAKSSSALPAELRPVVSGGINPELPENVTDLVDTLEVLSRSAGYYVAFADRIQRVRERIEREYPDGDLVNPNIYIKSYDRTTRKSELGESDRYKKVIDPNGEYIPHTRTAVILGQELKDDDTVIEGKHWLLGHVYEANDQGEQMPAGKFIEDGLRGNETVVNFKILVRPDFIWVPKNSFHQVVSPIFPNEQTVFEDLPHSA